MGRECNSTRRPTDRRAGTNAKLAVGMNAGPREWMGQGAEFMLFHRARGFTSVVTHSTASRWRSLEGGWAGREATRDEAGPGGV